MTYGTLLRMDQAGPASAHGWLWPGRVSAGYCWLIAGRPASGKSSFVAAVIASLTTGAPFPEARCPRGRGASS